MLIGVVELKSAEGVKVITPKAEISTVPFETAIVWAFPVRAVPLIETMESASPSTSVSLLSGVKVTVLSSATV